MTRDIHRVIRKIADNALKVRSWGDKSLRLRWPGALVTDRGGRVTVRNDIGLPLLASLGRKVSVNALESLFSGLTACHGCDTSAQLVITGGAASRCR